tara:strand:- start:315 stop:692 length:378 start_codon:yes stop_codon:yes gene_type:complete
MLTNKLLPKKYSADYENNNLFFDWVPRLFESNDGTNIKLLFLYAFFISLHAVWPTNLLELGYAFASTYAVFWILFILEMCINLICFHIDGLKKKFSIGAIAAICYWLYFIYNVMNPIINKNISKI